MLEVQKYLKSFFCEKSLLDLKEELGIESKPHPTLPLFLLNYDQIESPKTNPIVMECRGLCLEAGTLKVVSMGFKRFFNYGEAPQINDAFDWTDFETFEKMDGSYIGITSYNGELLIHTRGSFAKGEINGCDRTWEDVVLECLSPVQRMFIEERSKYTFVFELVGPYNRVVKMYPKPELYLLTIGDKEALTELSTWTVDQVAKEAGFLRPQIYKFTSVSAILEHLDKMEQEKSSDEGFVIRDRNGLRMKIKSKWYLHLHRLHCNGNIASPKVLLPIILAGEEDEILAYFPYLEPLVKEIRKTLDETYNKLFMTWWHGNDIKERKKFAFYVLDNCKEFSSLLFAMRDKFDMDGNEDDLKAMFRSSGELIYKVLFKDK